MPMPHDQRPIPPAPPAADESASEQPGSEQPASEDELQRAEMQRRWEKEFGPTLSPQRQRASGIILLTVLFAILALVFITVSGR